MAGKTPLACSVSCGKVIAVRYLLHKGADLNKQDAMGFAPLHYAAKQGYLSVHACISARTYHVSFLLITA
jgi:ankyrin repeat protein